MDFIVIIFFLIFIINLIILSNTDNIKSALNKQSKSIKLVTGLPTNLPVIKLINNNQVFSFLVDTGSNISQIDSDSFTRLQPESFNGDDQVEIQGIGAVNSSTTSCVAKFTDTAKNNFKLTLLINSNFAPVKSAIKKSSGIELDGIIGTDFLIKYDYSIDFKDLDLKKVK